jgi:hypothetical protein
MTVKFFRGTGATRLPLEDEVFLDCGDGYRDLPEKIRAIMRWACSQGYDFTLKCDDDVVLDPQRLWASDFRNHDFSGRGNRPPKKNSVRLALNRPLTYQPVINAQNTPAIDHDFWVPYGFCYMLSRKAMEIIANQTELPYRNNDDEKWISTVLHRNSILLARNEHYALIQDTGDRPIVVRTDPRFRPPIQSATVGGDKPEHFAWCVHLAINGDTSIPLDTKLKVFHKLFAEKVSKFRLEGTLAAQEKSNPSY